jgi:hypothetical protein
MGWPEPIPDDCQEIPLWRRISGNRFNPVYKIVGYTIVEDADFQRINKDQWFMMQNSQGDCYVFRIKRQNGKQEQIFMHREILGLPRNAGRGGDQGHHVNHNTLDNRRVANLVIVTHLQNSTHRKKYVYRSEGLPKGVYENGKGYLSRIWVNGSDVSFPTLSKMNEAWFMRKEAEKYIQGEFAYSGDIPEDQTPIPERQQWLRELVIQKLREKGFLV